MSDTENNNAANGDKINAVTTVDNVDDPRSGSPMGVLATGSRKRPHPPEPEVDEEEEAEDEIRNAAAAAAAAASEADYMDYRSDSPVTSTNASKEEISVKDISALSEDPESLKREKY